MFTQALNLNDRCSPDLLRHYVMFAGLCLVTLNVPCIAQESEQSAATGTEEQAEIDSTVTRRLFAARAEPVDHEKVQQLANVIDQLIDQRLSEASIVPAPLAGDAELMRRAYLDICGKIPRASEVRDFMASESAHKRRELVDRLLDSPSYIIHYTNLWRAAMVPEAETDQQVRISLPGFESWLRSRIAENRNFAEIAEEILTLPISSQNNQALVQPDRPSPAAFYQAKEAVPERMAAATSRLFLGIRIDCAQCHDHPFDAWKQEQFWGYTAFFTDMQPPSMGVLETVQAALAPEHSIKIPDKDVTVWATFLDGAQPEWKSGDGSRAVLAKWIVSPENPYFAKAAANRVWSYHFGIGLVEPMDDFGPNNPPSHPAVLDLLAQEFVKSGYDFKFLIRVITATKAYQRTSQQTDPSQTDPRSFARMAVRGLTPEQIFDSLAQATAYQQPFDPEQPLNFNNDTTRQEFVEAFSNQTESAVDRSSTILQALTLMNGRFIADATDLSDSQTLAAVIDAPFLDQPEKVDALYLATLSRLPTDVERDKCVAFLDSESSDGVGGRGLSDLFWALLNSSEFLLNH